MDEAEASWLERPDVIFVQAGVGGLLAAVACWADFRFGRDRPAVVGVEPETAACVQHSILHGQPTTLPGPFDSVMAGLRCGEMSPVAFEALSSLVDGYVAIEDRWAFDAIRRLATPLGDDARVTAGASGAAGLGGLLATLGVLVLVTEAVTDPVVFEHALSRG
jgi:diaminopropionate ammonia-lyase